MSITNDYIIIRKLIVVLFVWISVTGCKERTIQLAAPKEQPISRSVEANVIALQNQVPPDEFPIPDLVKVRAGKPDILPKETNLPITLRPERRMVSNPPLKRVPGRDRYSFPQELSVEPRVVRASLPDIILAKDPRMKTDNPSSFIFYSRVEGLPQDDISSIAMDSRGNLWIGTYGAGVIRFDGRYFAQFTVEHGLPDNFVLNLAVSQKGEILIGTRLGGVVIFDGTDFKIYDEKDVFSSRIETIFQDSEGNIWLGTYRNGVVKYDGETFSVYDQSTGLAGNTVYSIVQDTAGNMWFGTRGDGISHFVGESFFNYSSRNGLPNDNILSMAFDEKGLLWIGTDGGGLVSFDGKTFEIYNTENGFMDNDITSIFYASDKKLWIGTRRSGLVNYEQGRFTHFRERDGLISSFVTKINEDLSGKLWFGTYGGGIGSWYGNIFRHYSAEEGLPESFIRAIETDLNGKTWFGTNSTGILTFNEDRILNYSVAQGMADHRVRSITADSNGDLWIGLLYGGFSIFDGEYFMSPPPTHLLSEIGVLSVLEQKNGTIWMASYGDGLFRIRDDIVTRYTENNGLPDDYLRKVIEDPDGNIWVATRENGVAMFNGDQFTHFSTLEGLPVNYIFDILFDSNGALWIGTDGGGLVRYKDGSMMHFAEQHGLGSNFVYSIAEDHQGKLWFGTRWGLSSLIGSSEAVKKELTSEQVSNAHSAGVFFGNHTRNQGFMGIGVNSRAMHQGKDGLMWIGANDILTAFHPGNVTADTARPYIYLLWVGLFNENVPWVDLISNQDTLYTLASGAVISDFSLNGITPWYGTPEGLKLAYRNNYIVFSFSAITKDIGSDVRYQHMLVGMDENWSPLTRSTEVHYGNLRPGSYQFKLRAMNKAGVFSDELTFEFRIKYPYWATWWAIGIYFITIVAVVIIAYHLKKKKARSEKLRKEEELRLQQQVEIAERSAEFKQNFLANMSHEIRTPLTGILGMADLLLKTPLNETQEDYMKTLIHSGENLRETINLVLDYSKIEAGKVKLNKEVFSVHDLFDKAEKLFLSICRKNILLKKHIKELVPPYLESDYQRVFQILNNLITNAVKFTEEGTISLIASLESSGTDNKEHLIKIAVKDTGMGIKQSAQKGLFRPFYQVEQSYNRSFEGTGLGLAICKELATILGGEIGVESIKGEGSTFWFTFKVREAERPLQKEKKPEKTEADTDVRSLMILLVEDKRINQKVITLVLKSMGHQVVIADNGQKALELYRPNYFDLILMDIQMPVMDGIAATQALKKCYPESPPIVGLSANAFEGDREKYMQMGMDEYLTKPVKESDFQRVIAKFF